MSCLKTEAQMRMTGELASSLYPISCPLAGGFGHLVAWRLAPRASPPAQLLPAPQSASPLAPPAPPLTLPTVLPDHAGHYLAPNWGRSVGQRKTGRLVRWSLRRSGWRRWRRLETLGWFPIGGSRCQNYLSSLSVSILGSCTWAEESWTDRPGDVEDDEHTKDVAVGGERQDGLGCRLVDANKE